MDFQKELLNLLYDTAIKTKKYLNVFEVTDSYLFSENIQKRKEIKDEFILLLGFLVSSSEKTDSLTAKISSLVCYADDNMNNDMTSYFSKILENYFLWRKSLLRFLDNSNSIILKEEGEFKYSLLMSYAQSFLNSTENLIGILNIKK